MKKALLFFLTTTAFIAPAFSADLSSPDQPNNDTSTLSSRAELIKGELRECEQLVYCGRLTPSLIGTIRSILKGDSDPNTPFEGSSPVAYAISYNLYHTTMALLDAGASLINQPSNKKHPLIKAVKSWEPENFMQLFRRAQAQGIDGNYVDPSGHSLLETALIHHQSFDDPKILLLLDNGARPTPELYKMALLLKYQLPFSISPPCSIMVKPSTYGTLKKGFNTRTNRGSNKLSTGGRICKG